MWSASFRLAKYCGQSARSAFGKINLAALAPSAHSPNPIRAFTMPEAQVLATPEKPQTDAKEYRVVRLGNGLRALLVADTRYSFEKLAEEEDEEGDEEGSAGSGSDDDDEDGDETDSDQDEEDDEGAGEASSKRSRSSGGLRKSAAALCVGVGSFSDPANLPGLAHFVEHMVFMGSQKYPDENDFDNFVHNHGGFDNAHTDCEHTTFYFDIQRKHFQQGLDRFAQFFVSPLMKQSAMEREREAVDSEFEQALPSDSNRREMMFGSLAKDGHPMAKFMWGNLSSLQPKDLSETDINKLLHEFRRRHYTGGNMTLAVQSQHDLDTLERWVRDSFGAVPDNGKDRESFGHLAAPFGKEDFHRVYKVAPVHDVYRVDLNWALPFLMDKYRCKPLHYLSWIIGHEGKGSLISHLREKVWALSLTAGNDGTGFQYNSTYSMFAITVTLTKEGYKCLDQVLSSVFSYLSMLRSSSPNERIFREIQRIERLHFDYGEEPQPGDNVETLAENMQLYPPKLYLTGDELLFDWNPEDIKVCVDELLPDKVNVFVSAKEVLSECNRVEPWFGTRYRAADISPERLKSWSSARALPGMHLPEENKFIAQDLQLKHGTKSGGDQKEPLTFPAKVESDAGVGELFFKADDKFGKPLAYVNFLVVTPVALSSAKEAVCLDVMINCVNLVMVEETYPADLAQLRFYLAPDERGFTVKVSGFNDKLHVLLETILKNIVQLRQKLKKPQFEAVRDQTKRHFYNHFLNPMRLVRDVRLSVVQDVFFPSTDKHAVVADLTMEDVLDLAERVTRGCFVHGLVQGNMNKDEAKACYSSVKRILGLTSSDSNKELNLRCRELTPGEKVLRVDTLNPRDGNTVVTNYYQELPGTLKSLSVLDLLNLILEEPVFDQLRTKEQLGYTVFSMVRNTHGVLGLSACKFTPRHVDDRIEAFLKNFSSEVLPSMSDEEFQGYVKTLCKEKLSADVSLSEEVTRNWAEITGGEYVFDRHLKEVQILERVKKADVIAALRSLLEGGHNFRKLSVQVLGNAQVSASRAGEAVEKEEHEAKDDAVFKVRVLAAQEDGEGGKDFVQDHINYRDALKVYPAVRIVK